MEKDDPRSILETIQTVVETAVNNDHVPLESIAVLTPIHYGDLGTVNLNTVLQSKLNPSTEKILFKDMEFRLHDKVIHTENDYSLGVYNGEVGFIVEFGDTSDAALTVAYPRKTVIYPRAKLGKLDLAYAMTIHKMQGSECRLVYCCYPCKEVSSADWKRRGSAQGSSERKSGAGIQSAQAAPGPDFAHDLYLF